MTLAQEFPRDQVHVCSQWWWVCCPTCSCPNWNIRETWDDIRLNMNPILIAPKFLPTTWQNADCKIDVINANLQTHRKTNVDWHFFVAMLPHASPCIRVFLFFWSYILYIRTPLIWVAIRISQVDAIFGRIVATRISITTTEPNTTKNKTVSLFNVVAAKSTNGKSSERCWCMLTGSLFQVGWQLPATTAGLRSCLNWLWVGGSLEIFPPNFWRSHPLPPSAKTSRGHRVRMRTVTNANWQLLCFRFTQFDLLQRVSPWVSSTWWLQSGPIANQVNAADAYWRGLFFKWGDNCLQPLFFVKLFVTLAAASMNLFRFALAVFETSLSEVRRGCSVKREGKSDRFSSVGILGNQTFILCSTSRERWRLMVVSAVRPAATPLISENRTLSLSVYNVVYLPASSQAHIQNQTRSKQLQVANYGLLQMQPKGFAHLFAQV